LQTKLESNFAKFRFGETSNKIKWQLRKRKQQLRRKSEHSFSSEKTSG
jgi:hypothetical protein